MPSASQIAGFLRQPPLQNKSMKQLHFLNVNTNLQKLKTHRKFSVGHGQKWVWPICSRDSKIDCILRMNRCNQQIFCMLVHVESD